MPYIEINAVRAISTQVRKAAAKIAELQEEYPLPSDTWDKLETIDDCLHEIATSLGD